MLNVSIGGKNITVHLIYSNIEIIDCKSIKTATPVKTVYLTFAALCQILKRFICKTQNTVHIHPNRKESIFYLFDVILSCYCNPLFQTGKNLKIKLVEF